MKTRQSPPWKVGSTEMPSPHDYVVVAIRGDAGGQAHLGMASCYLISVTSDLSSFCSSSLAASRMGMTSARAVSASVFHRCNLVLLLYLHGFLLCQLLFSSAVGGRGRRMKPPKAERMDHCS